jgi:hypothetical protein
MIAAVAAAVSAVSALRLVSRPEGLSGKLALGGVSAAADELGFGIAADGCAAGPTKATGCANAVGELMMAGTGALLTGALWRPTE